MDGFDTASDITPESPSFSRSDWKRAAFVPMPSRPPGEATQHAGGRETVRPVTPEFTRREIQALTLLARGWSNKRIAAEMFLSQETVKFHLKSIYRKLGVHHRFEAILVGAQRGLVQIHPQG